MKHLKISDSFKEIISIGLLSKQKKFGRRDLTAWEHKFDISSWEEWEVSSLVSKNEIIELGKVQEVILRAVFKKNNELGHTPRWLQQLLHLIEIFLSMLKLKTWMRKV